MSRRSERRDARQERQSSRQDSRTERKALKTEADMAGYAAGFDPNAWKGAAVTGALDLAGSFAGAKNGGGDYKSAGAGGGDGTPESPTGTSQPTKINPMIIVGLIAVVAIFMFKKK